MLNIAIYALYQPAEEAIVQGLSKGITGVYSLVYIRQTFDLLGPEDR